MEICAAQVEKTKRLVLLGEPGAGKTSALRYLAVTLAERFIRDPMSSVVPIYVELSDWERLQKRDLSADLTDLLHYSIQRRSNINVSRDILKNALEARDVALIFDGLDEIRRVDGRRKFVESVLTLADQTTRHVLVIGSRRHAVTDVLRIELDKRLFMFCEPARLDDEMKLRIISRYVHGIEPEDVLSAINASYRVARLSDNALLLRLFSEQFELPGGNLPRTRGRALEKHVDRCFGRVELLSSEERATYGKRLLSDVAELMREKSATEIDEDDADFRKLGDDSLSQIGISRGELLDALVESRLIDRLSEETIQFALPQFEDYFRARPIARTLRSTIKSQSPRKLLSLEIVADPELEDVLVMAAGLLTNHEVSVLAGVLSDEKQMIVKARILGEADAEREEREFGDRLEERVSSVIFRALKGLSRIWLTILSLWWLLMLPVAMAMNRIQAISGYLALGFGFIYLVAIPWLFGRLHKTLLRRYTAELEVVAPQVMYAFSFLRTSSVRIRLHKLHITVEAQRPSYEDPNDVFVRLLDMIESHIDIAADLAERDSDTMMDELMNNPQLIGQCLALSKERFKKEYVELFERFIVEIEADLGTKLRCLEKLIAVARTELGLHSLVIQVLVNIAECPGVAPSLRKLAKIGTKVPIRRPHARLPNLMIAMTGVGFILSGAILGTVALFPSKMAFIGVSLFSGTAVLLSAGTIRAVRPEWHRYAWRYTVLWFAMLVCSGALMYWQAASHSPHSETSLHKVNEHR